MQETGKALPENMGIKEMKERVIIKKDKPEAQGQLKKAVLSSAFHRVLKNGGRTELQFNHA